MNGDFVTLSILTLSVIIVIGFLAYGLGHIKLKHITIGCTVAITVFLIIIIPTLIPPDPINTLYDKAQTAVDSGKFDLAIQFYSDIVTDYPNEEKAWHEKGKLLNRFEKCDESLQHYTKYVANFPESERAKEGYEISKSLCN